MSVKIQVTSADELRDALSTSGVFEMTDCTVVIDCPLDAETEEVRKMVNILESAIHVNDVKVVGLVETDGFEYIISITEVEPDFIAKREKRIKE